MLSGTTANPARPSAEATRPVTPVQMASIHASRKAPGYSLPSVRLAWVPCPSQHCLLHGAGHGSHATHTHVTLLGTLHGTRAAWAPGPSALRGFPFRGSFWSSSRVSTDGTSRRSVSFQGQISSCYAHAHAQPMREAPAVPLDSRGGRGPSVDRLCWLARLLRHRATH